MTTTTSRLTTRVLDLATLEGAAEQTLLDLLHDSLAGGPTGERTSAFFRWKHVDNPFGPSLALAAFDGERLVGIRLVMRWAFRLDGRRVTAGRMVDTATHPDYRGRGIFQSLTRSALELARDDTDLIFNTPNASSKPGYLKMGWQVVGVLPTSFSPVHPLRFLRGARAALGAAGQRAVFDSSTQLPPVHQVLDEHREDLAALLAARSAGPRPSRLVTDSSPAYLRWRYATAPGLDYRAIPVVRDGRLRALGIGRVRPRGGLRELTLAEGLTEPGATGDLRRILRGSRRSGVDHVATHLPGAAASPATLARCGFVTTGRVGLTHTTLPLRPLPVDVTSPSSWDLTLGDIEVF
jgi:GNAT superfamily N-acetyltransferase